MEIENTSNRYQHTFDQLCRCKAIRNDGKPCRSFAWGGTRFCFSHRHLALFAQVIESEQAKRGPSELVNTTP